MVEVTTEAVVLDKEDLGEQDSRVFLYTEDFGKISAKAVSLRKIVSKLSAHLEPLNHVSVRLAAKGDFFGAGGFHVTDALLMDSIGDSRRDFGWVKKMIAVLGLISKSVPEGARDRELWNFLKAARKKEIDCDISEALKILGFDPSFASCELCNRSQPDYFYAKNNFFVCQLCNFGAPQNQLIKLN